MVLNAYETREVRRWFRTCSDGGAPKLIAARALRALVQCTELLHLSQALVQVVCRLPKDRLPEWPMAARLVATREAC